MAGGSANVTALVATPEGAMVVRIYRHPDVPRFTCELETLGRLSDIDAPTPRPGRWGIACPVFGTPFLAYPWLSGEPLSSVARRLDTAGVAEAVSRLMAVAIDRISTLPVTAHGYLHVAAEPQSPNTRTNHHRSEEYATVIDKHRLIGPGLLARTLQFVEEHNDMVSTTSPNLVHPDLKPGNVLVGPDDVSIIDWELPVGGHPALNYGGLLAEGLSEPALSNGLRHHLNSLTPEAGTAAVTAGLLRCLETLSYLPTNPSIQDGRKVRPDADDLAASIRTLLTWDPR